MACGLGRSYFCRLSYRPVPGVRKSGIPAAVETPAPQSTTTFRTCCSFRMNSATPATSKELSTCGSSDSSSSSSAGNPEPASAANAGSDLRLPATVETRAAVIASIASANCFHFASKSSSAVDAGCDASSTRATFACVAFSDSSVASMLAAATASLADVARDARAAASAADAEDDSARWLRAAASLSRIFSSALLTVAPVAPAGAGRSAKTFGLEATEMGRR